MSTSCSRKPDTNRAFESSEGGSKSAAAFVCLAASSCRFFILAGTARLRQNLLLPVQEKAR
jgi:hypothetical protein